jgi:hypothetical protein
MNSPATTHKTKARSATNRRDGSRRIADQGADLTGLSVAGWDVLTDEERRGLIGNLDASYKEYLENLYKSADLCVDRYNEFTKSHVSWRRTAIIGSGILACLNFTAASKRVAMWENGLIPIVAAIAALILALLANLETFSNSAEKAQTFRESRELFLDAAQEFDRVWTIHVIALGDTLEAYANAAELYKRIIATDSELRSKFKEQTKDRKG